MDQAALAVVEGVIDVAVTTAVLAPQPAEGVGQQNTTVVGAVATIAQDQTEVIACFGECGRNTQVAREPVPLRLVPAQVPVTGLQEDAHRLARNAGNQGGVRVASRHLLEAGQAANDPPNLSGRSHAAVKAQLPPLLPPQMPHRSGSSVTE